MDEDQPVPDTSYIVNPKDVIPRMWHVKAVQHAYEQQEQERDDPMAGQYPFPNAPNLKEDFQRAHDEDLRRIREAEKQEIHEDIKNHVPQPTLTPNGSLRRDGDEMAQEELAKEQQFEQDQHMEREELSHSHDTTNDIVDDMNIQSEIQLQEDFQQAAAPEPSQDQGMDRSME